MTDAHPSQAAGARRVETVAIIAPGGYDTDAQRLPRAIAYFAGHGARARAFVDDAERYGRFSGTDAQRLHWLHAAADDPTVDIAIALRGGYGATRLLPKIDFARIAEAVRNRGARFVGHSDFTAIHLALLATTGAISFAGPMAGPDFGMVATDEFTESHFWGAMHDGALDATFPTGPSSDLDVSGVLWGGNLAMLASLLGTPWMPSVDDGILFIEDINEQPYRIERMLLSLQQAGVLDRQAMVLVGDFSGVRPTPYDQDYGLDDALERVRETTPTPIVTGLPFGHGARKLTLAVGASASVRIIEGQARLCQRWSLAA